VVAECVLCYLDKESLSSILSGLAVDLDQHTIFISYDPVLSVRESPTSDPVHSKDFSAQMRDSFALNGAPLLSSSPSIVTQMQTFRRNGWIHVVALDIESARRLFISEQNGDKSSGDSFDEFASLATIHNHYAISIASLSGDLFQTVLSASLSSRSPAERLFCRLIIAESRFNSLIKPFQSSKSRYIRLTKHLAFGSWNYARAFVAGT
jgi:hypothetical protein